MGQVSPTPVKVPSTECEDWLLDVSSPFLVVSVSRVRSRGRVGERRAMEVEGGDICTLLSIVNGGDVWTTASLAKGVAQQ